MIVSGRCHGPGCQQLALAESGFCSERCQANWHTSLDTAPELTPAGTRMATWTVLPGDFVRDTTRLQLRCGHDSGEVWLHRMRRTP